ncbi:AzlC family ABC transporter permease [Adlercreutzia sp. ZJ138]|uniref:AzlC family ABC transporter permease n=1 Tax=Adlercreutzia sp. ZJ138 TaxID=2709405 RepID=UPI0013ED645E|nr:AzlC family ABC transporter permease [Adlercreutzia sp. ZJ138]
MISRDDIRQSFQAAFPIMLGYVAIGIPCGILSNSIGMNALQVFVMSIVFYSGAGQFMIPNMWIAGAPMASIIASVSLVNTRQMLYSAAFAPVCRTANKLLSFMFAASVTDESYGVNVIKFEEGGWTVARATMVNAFSNSSWTLSNVLGVLVGDAIGIPLAVAAFAMTSIFICLLLDQKMTPSNVVAIVVAFIGVFVCKCVGLSGPAILIGAVCGVVAAMVFATVRGESLHGEADGSREAEVS